MKTCKACGHVELRDTEPIGAHEYSNDYTIDKEATKEENGLMSRHCIRCKDFTDQISYSLKDSDEGNIDNTFDNKIPSNNYIDKLHKEQYPDNKPVDSSTQVTSSQNPVTSDTASSNPDNSNSSNPVVEEQPLIEPDENINVSVIDKIKEVIPSFEFILSIFIIAAAVLFIFVLA